MPVRHPGFVTVTLRPMPSWPHGETSSRRPAQFKSRGYRINYERTLDELKYEVWQLDGDSIIIGVGLNEWDIRQDGAPRANARPMNHPGVEVSFNSRFGRLTYATDVFDDWRDNVRAVAKGLEALRAVERWGVAKRGQQYAGFALLSAGPGREERGKQIVAEYGSIADALRATHPDTGNGRHTTEDFMAVQAYRVSKA